MAEDARDFEVGPDGEMSPEEHARFIELLREGLEDVRAGRVVTSEEVERRVAAAIARGAARYARRERLV